MKKKNFFIGYVGAVLFFTFAYSEDGQLGSSEFSYQWALSARQGKRPSMEDAFVYDAYNFDHFFAIYDGTQGARAAQLAQQYLKDVFLDSVHKIEILTKKPIVSYSDIINAVFSHIESRISSQTSSGTTATFAYFDQGRVCIAWLGNSTGMIIRDGAIYFKTKDHTALNEQDRLEKAGAPLLYREKAGEEKMFLGRSDFKTHLSRAFGLANFKKTWPNSVLNTPEVYQAAVKVGDIICIGSSGLWEALSSDEIVSALTDLANNDVKSVSKNGTSGNEFSITQGNNEILQLKAQQLRDRAYQSNPKNNISIMVIRVVKKGDTEIVNGKKVSTPDTPIQLDLSDGKLLKNNLKGVVLEGNEYNVTQIDMRNNNLKEISPELVAFLNRFPNLEVLLLGNNQLSDLPSDFLTGNPFLRTLGLAQNNFTDVPSIIQKKIDQFIVVSLVGNKIIQGTILSWPDTIRMKVGVQSQRIPLASPIVSQVDLSGGKLAQADLKKVVNSDQDGAVVSLNLSGNQLTEITPEIMDFIARFYNLRELNISDNEIPYLPDNFLEKNKKVNVINLMRNEFTLIPPQLLKRINQYSVINLERNRLSSNQLYNLPENIRKKGVIKAKDQRD